MTAKKAGPDFKALREEFPRKDIHWRAQSVTKQQPYKALALAYIDARHVMERLDQVCGPAGWRDSYVETAKGRVLCTLEILVDGEWISKSDGAGTTDVEGDKGAISDALKRAAVKWGIGRYLYGMGTPWVPCEVNQNFKWKKWTKDPWELVRDAPVIPDLEDEEPPLPDIPEPRTKLEGANASTTALRARLTEMHGKIMAASTVREIDAICTEYGADYEQGRVYLPGWINGDPAKPDSKGLAKVIDDRRFYIGLIASMKSNETQLSLSNWRAAAESDLEYLDSDARDMFDVELDNYSRALTLVARASA